MRFRHVSFLILITVLHFFLKCSEESVTEKVTEICFDPDRHLGTQNLKKCLIKHKENTPANISNLDQFLLFYTQLFPTMEQLYQESLLETSNETQSKKQLETEELLSQKEIERITKEDSKTYYLRSCKKRISSQ